MVIAASLTVIAVALLVCAVWFPKEPGLMVGVGAALCLLVPTWIGGEILGLTLEVRTIVSAVLMVAYCAHPRGFIWSRINAIDIAISGLVIWHVISDAVHGEQVTTLPLRAYGEWALPYVAGRYALAAGQSVSRLAPWFTSVGCIIAAGAIFESLFGANLWEYVFGEVDDLVTRTVGLRYDAAYRAIGPTRNPIFLGIVLMLLVPWAIALLGSEESRRRRVCGIAALLILFAGLLSTLSRGPLLCLLLAVAIMASYRWIWFRRVFLAAIVISVVPVVVGWSKVVELVDLSEKRGQDQVYRVVEVDGEFERYNYFRHRILVFQIYSPIVLRGGPLGFGTEAVSSFPPNVPLSLAGRTREILGIVDNSWLLVGLRFGWIGLGFLAMMFGCSICKAFSLARQSSLVTYPDGPAFPVALGSILIGVAVEILTVFSSYDFMFWILFTAGVVSGLVVLDGRMRRGEVEFD